MNAVQKNKALAVAVSGLRTAALLFASGTLMQTFLSVLGFEERWIYLHSALTQAVNMLTILLSSRWLDTGNVIRRAALVQLPPAVLFLCYLPLCIRQSASPESFGLLLGISLVQTAVNGLYTVCEYKLPYFVYRAEEFGPVTALCGVVASGVSFGVGAAVSALSAYVSYVFLMMGAFVISCGLLVLACCLQNAMTSLIDMDAVQQPQKGTGNGKIPVKMVLTHPSFVQLLPANLLRGLANGTTTVLTVMALSMGFDEMVATLLVSVQSAASLAGCMSFGVLSTKAAPRACILWGSVLFLAFPLILLPNSFAFLAACAVVFFGRTLVDYAVPAALLYPVPVEIAGPYHALRMVIHFFGTFLTTTVAAFVPVPALVIVTVVLQLASGAMFYWTPVMRNTGVSQNQRAENRNC